jgi:cell division protein FtsB
MNEFTYNLMKLFLCSEFLIFIMLYIASPQGVQILIKFKTENRNILARIEQLRHENNIIRQEINEWQRSLFAVEKSARELLQMSKKGELLYIKERSV